GARGCWAGGEGGGSAWPMGPPIMSSIKDQEKARSVTRPCRNAQRVAAVRNGPAGDPASAKASATVLCRRMKAGHPGQGLILPSVGGGAGRGRRGAPDGGRAGPMIMAGGRRRAGRANHPHGGEVA